MTAGAVKTNVKEVPPVSRVSDTTPVPLGPYVGTAKSVVAPMATPIASDTLTVQDITSPIRTNVLDKAV